MNARRTFVSIVCIVIVSSWTGLAGAQPANPPAARPDVRAIQLPDGRVARLVVTWGNEDCRARFAIDGLEPVPVHDGPVAGTIVAGHGVVVLAYVVEDPRSPFRLRVSRPDGPGLGDPVSVDRPGARAGVPFAVVATSVLDGFAVFFQEVEAEDPSAAHTYLLGLDPRGVPRGPAREVEVPWSLAAVAWNGHGFQLALIYPGDGNGMRLSMVSATVDGEPQQHPDWASRAGFIADVHLAVVGGRVLAFYRGGQGGDRLLESDVTVIRGWGSEPPAARDHGPLPQDRVIVLDTRDGDVQPRNVAAE
jgi:hypothetical protein